MTPFLIHNQGCQGRARVSNSLGDTLEECQTYKKLNIWYI